MTTQNNTSDALRSPHIPQGYKNSTLGVIPEEWEVKRLGEIGKVSMCKRVMKNETLAIGEIPFFKIGTFGKIADAYITKQLFDEYVSKYSYPKIGDILISAAGTIGRAVIYNGEPSYYQDSNIVWIDNNEEIVLNKFLHYCYATIKWNTDTGTIPRLYNDSLSNTRIICPQLPEQQRIATLLSVWDTAIEKQTQLVTALQTRKRALMQQLLTGKKRLPGFTDKWEVLKIKDFSNDVSIRNNQDKKLDVLSCTKYNGLVLSLEYFGRQIFANDTSTYKIVPKNHFAYATNHIEEGSIGYQNQFSEALISPMYTVFKTDQNKVNDDFLYTVFKTHKLICEYQSHMEGSIDRRGGLRWKSFSSIKIDLPSLPEQTAIASVLTTADSEIRLAETRLAHLRQQKKGLMQVLLTGKKRVEN